MSTVSILVADDHPVVRHGVRTLLETNAGWKIVAQVSDGRAAVRKSVELKPNLAILDIGMPLLNGLEAARQIARYSPGTRLLILSMYDGAEIVEKAIASGVQGFVRKSEAEEDLIMAARAVLNNKLFFPAAASVAPWHKPDRNSTAPVPRLSPREIEVVQLITEGNSNKQVASILGVSRRTVENHRARIMHKLGLHSVSELVRYAVRQKIVAA